MKRALRTTFLMLMPLGICSAQMEVFDSIQHALQAAKYAWEQSQWAEKLALLKSTLDETRQYVQLANQVKTAIGDPSQVASLIDQQFLDGALSELGIGAFIQDLQEIGRDITALTSESANLFEPIDASAWTDPASAAAILSKLQNPSYRMERYKLMEQSISRFDELQKKVNTRIGEQRTALATLSKKLESAKDDAEVQKIQGQVQVAQEVLRSLEHELDKARQGMRDQATLVANRDQMEHLAVNASYASQLDFYQSSTAAASRTLLSGEKITVPPVFAPPASGQGATPGGSSSGPLNGSSSFSNGIVARLGESTAGVPGTENGNLACAWVVNDLYRQMTGSAIAPAGGELSVDATIQAMLDQPSKFRVVSKEEAEKSGMDYVIASSYAQGSSGRHVGIGNGKTVWSNSSTKQQISQNYTTDSWTSRYGTTLYFILQ